MHCLTVCFVTSDYSTPEYYHLLQLLCLPVTLYVSEWVCVFSFGALCSSYSYLAIAFAENLIR